MLSGVLHSYEYHAAHLRGWIWPGQNAFLHIFPSNIRPKGVQRNVIPQLVDVGGGKKEIRWRNLERKAI